MIVFSGAVEPDGKALGVNGVAVETPVGMLVEPRTIVVDICPAVEVLIGCPVVDPPVKRVTFITYELVVIMVEDVDV